MDDKEKTIPENPDLSAFANPAKAQSSAASIKEEGIKGLDGSFSKEKSIHLQYPQQEEESAFELKQEYIKPTAARNAAGLNQPADSLNSEKTKNNMGTLPSGQFVSKSESKADVRTEVETKATAEQEEKSLTKTQQKMEEVKKFILQGIVLSNTPYKERDGIIQLATKDGVVSVLAKGIQGSRSKNARLCQPGVVVDMYYQPRYSQSRYFLINGQVQWTPTYMYKNLQQQALTTLFFDLAEKKGVNPFIYNLLEDFLKSMEDEKDNQIWLDACWMLARWFELEGIAPYVDGCVECGRTDHINGFDMNAGGFLCQDHVTDPLQNMPRSDLQRIRALFRAREEHKDYLLEHFQWDRRFMDLLMDWYIYQMDHLPASFRFWKQIEEMNT